MQEQNQSQGLQSDTDVVCLTCSWQEDVTRNAIAQNFDKTLTTALNQVSIKVWIRYVEYFCAQVNDINAVQILCNKKNYFHESFNSLSKIFKLLS